MAQYTILNKAEINQIAARYISLKINSFELLKGGSENTNYLLTTDSINYVLTICEQKTDQEAKNLVKLLELLASNNFSTSVVVRSVADDSITYWNEKPVLFKEYIEGQVIEDLTPHLLECIGRELGKLHKIDVPENLLKELSYSMDHFDEVNLYAPGSSFKVWLEEIKKQIHQHPINDLPKTVIHSDVFFNNVIVANDHATVTIMDFEEASYYYRIFDIGMCIIGVCSIKKIPDLKKVSHLLKGYEQEVGLLDIEKRALQTFTAYASAAMSFWRH